MVNHWYLRVSDGKNFKNSMTKGIWSLKSWASDGKSFMKNARENDLLWFLTNVKGGRKLIAVATFISFNTRILGPLIATTLTNEDLGWSEGDWDTEIHYKTLYLIDKLNLCPDISLLSSYINTKSVHSHINLDEEYKNLIRYSQVEPVNGERN